MSTHADFMPGIKSYYIKLFTKIIVDLSTKNGALSIYEFILAVVQ